MDSGPSRKASLRPRRRQAYRNESENETDESERARSPSSIGPPPIRRARLTEDAQESETTVVPSIPSQNSRNARITEEQLRELSTIYETDPYANLERRRDIAMRMNLNLSQVTSYYQRQRRLAAQERRNNTVHEGNTITPTAESEHEQATAPPGNESVDDQPSTSVQPRVSGEGRVVLRESPPSNTDVEIAREAESSNVAVYGQTSSTVNEEVFIGPNSYAEALRRSLRGRELAEASNATNDQPSASAQLFNYSGPPRFRDNPFVRDLAATRDAANALEFPPGQGPPPPRRLYPTLRNIPSTVTFPEDTQVEFDRTNTMRAPGQNVQESLQRFLRRTSQSVRSPRVNVNQRNTSPDEQVSPEVGLSLTPNMAIPQEVLDSFGPEGLKEEDDEEVTDIEEMVFRKLLRKKMVCEICMVHIKQFRCFKCFYSMCKECSDTIKRQHTGQMSCPQCRTKQQEFLPIILPRL